MTKIYRDVLDKQRLEVFEKLRVLARDGGVLADLASNKAFTIGKRGIWRDYVDVFFLLKFKLVSLDQVIEEANKRFEDQFSAKLFLEQLVYTKDIVDFNIDFLGKACLPEEINSYLEDEVKEYIKTLA